MSAHSVGPFYFHRPSGEDYIDVQTAPHPQLCEIVWTAWGGGNMTQRIEANARLAAAAPELLDALKAILVAYDGTFDALGPSMRLKIATAIAAVKKAEGRA